MAGRGSVYVYRRDSPGNKLRSTASMAGCTSNTGSGCVGSTSSISAAAVREPEEGNVGYDALPVDRWLKRPLAEEDVERLGEDARSEDINPEADALSEADRECCRRRAGGPGERIFMLPPPIAPLRFSVARNARSSCDCTPGSGAMCTVPASCAYEYSTSSVLG